MVSHRFRNFLVHCKYSIFGLEITCVFTPAALSPSPCILSPRVSLWVCLLVVVLLVLGSFRRFHPKLLCIFLKVFLTLVKSPTGPWGLRLKWCVRHPTEGVCDVNNCCPQFAINPCRPEGIVPIESSFMYKFLVAVIQVSSPGFVPQCSIDGQVRLVCLVHLQSDNFCLFLHQQTDKQQPSVRTMSKC
jgi:hypothetical protein